LHQKGKEMQMGAGAQKEEAVKVRTRSASEHRATSEVEDVPQNVSRSEKASHIVTMTSGYCLVAVREASL
jgi:hypothetical protein